MTFLKLLKMELKCSYRSFLIIYVLTLVLALMTGLSDGRVATMSGLFGMGYIVVIMVACILCLAAIIRNYHSSMFSRASYLTHTLPVSSLKLILSKMAGSVIWVFLTGAVLYISVILLVLTARILPLGDILSSLLRVDVAWIALALLYILSSLMSFIALCYLVMNMAHTPLVRNHRTVAAMGLFLLITVFKSWLDGLVFDSVLLQQEGMNAQDFFASFSGYAQPAWMVIGWEFLWVVLFTAAGVWILKHQMEIE